MFTVPIDQEFFFLKSYVSLIISCIIKSWLYGKPLCENQNSISATCRYEYLWTVQLYLDLIKGIIISTRKEMQMYTFFLLCYAL